MERSRDGSRLALAINEGGYSRLYVLDTKSRKLQPVANVPKGVINSFSLHDDGRRLALGLSSAKTSSDAYVLDLLDGKAPTRWTSSETGA